MKSKQFLKEGFLEDAQEAHVDHEVQMARVDCYYAAEHAIVLHKLLRNISEEQGLEGWVASKITLANDYLKSVREHLEYQMMNSDADEDDFLPIAEGLNTVKKKFVNESSDSAENFERGPWYVILQGKAVTSDGEPKRFNWLNGAKTYFRSLLDNDPEMAERIKREYDEADDKKSVIYYSKTLPSDVAPANDGGENSIPSAQSVSEDGERPGLWANIRAKRKRIAGGSGERMRKPGSKGAPSEKDLKSIRAASNESIIRSKNKFHSDYKPKAIGLSFSDLNKASNSTGKSYKQFNESITKNLKLPRWVNTLELYGYYTRHLAESKINSSSSKENELSDVEEKLFTEFNDRSSASVDSVRVGDKVALLHLATLRVPGIKLVAKLNGFLEPKQIVKIHSRGSFQQIEFEDGSLYPEKDTGELFQMVQTWNMTKLFSSRESASKAFMLYKLVGKKMSNDLDFDISVEQGVAEGYSLKKTNVNKYMEPGDTDEYTQDINIKDTDYEIINNKTGQVVGTASWTTNDYFGPGALKITMKNGATRYLDIWANEKGNPQTAFNRFVKDPKTAKKYKEQGVAESWKEKAAGATIGAAALGGIGAAITASPPTYVNGIRHEMSFQHAIPRNAEQAIDDRGRKVYVWISKGPGIKSAGQQTHRLYYPVDQVKEEQGVAEGLGDEFGDFAKKFGQNRGKNFLSRTQGPKPVTTAITTEMPPLDRDQLIARLRELQSQFDPQYQHSDDHGFWTQQHEIAKEISSIKRELGKSDAQRDSPYKVDESAEFVGPVEAWGTIYNSRDQKVVWRKIFPSEAEANKWADRNNAIVLGMKEVKTKSDNIKETNSGSVATVVNPTPKDRSKVGTLFGGTYKQSKTRSKK